MIPVWLTKMLLSGNSKEKSGRANGVKLIRGLFVYMTELCGKGFSVTNLKGYRRALATGLVKKPYLRFFYITKLILER